MQAGSKRCASCSGAVFVSVPGVEIEIHRSTSALGRIGANLLVCEACGRVELMPTLCRTDTAWIDAIEPARHRLRFVRPSTFATASTCRMWFMRTDGDDAAARGADGA